MRGIIFADWKLGRVRVSMERAHPADTHVQASAQRSGTVVCVCECISV